MNINSLPGYMITHQLDLNPGNKRNRLHMNISCHLQQAVGESDPQTEIVSIGGESDVTFRLVLLAQIQRIGLPKEDFNSLLTEGGGETMCCLVRAR